VIPARLFLRNHFSSFPSVHYRAVEEVTSGASESFRRNQFSSCPGDRTGNRGSREVRPARSSRRQLLFDGTTFPHSPGSNQRASLKPRDRGSQRVSLRSLFAEPFPHSLQFTKDPWPHPRFSPVARSLAPRCMEIAEFWQYGKRARRCSDCFRQHPDAILAKVAKEMAPLGEMANL
jgi:hypothetical protein